MHNGRITVNYDYIIEWSFFTICLDKAGKTMKSFSQNNSVHTLNKRYDNIRPRQREI
jgi:hypothetical protein